MEKYGNVDFGRCPRSLCQGQPVLPVGLSDVTREFSVEVFCPRCHETYHPRSSKHANLDGAYFGTTFCHLFLLTHPQHIVPQPTEKYVPRIFGFRINENSQYYKLRKTSGNTISNGTSSSTSAGGANSNSVKASSSNTSAVRNNNNGAAAGALLVSSTGATPLAGAHSNSNNAVAMPSKQGSGGGNTAKTTLVSPSKGIA